MTIRKIRIWPDDALTEVAAPIETFDEELHTLIDDMFETMYKAHGVGLAATQIAVNKRVVVIDLNPTGDTSQDYLDELEDWGFKGPVAIVNPTLVEPEGNISWNEGCLSLPGITETIKRRGHITLQAFDRDGIAYEHRASGLYAVALQHEIDHLDGKLFVDYLSRLKRDVIKRKMLKLKDLYDNDGVAAANE
ncbi:MAG: peptide deformylase [Myxococcota bacterium]